MELEPGCFLAGVVLEPGLQPPDAFAEPLRDGFNRHMVGFWQRRGHFPGPLFELSGYSAKAPDVDDPGGLTGHIL